ncbi:hypothetical protein EPN44_15325 [bacterium]|nr:MAG: hypothetical protein EPN44_15325 [bacterium]
MTSLRRSAPVALACITLLALPALAQANPVVVQPYVCPPASVAPVSDLYVLQSRMLQQQLNASLMRQLDRSQQSAELSQSLDRLRARARVDDVDQRLQRNLLEQRLLQLEQNGLGATPAPPAAVGGST